MFLVLQYMCDNIIIGFKIIVLKNTVFQFFMSANSPSFLPLLGCDYTLQFKRVPRVLINM